MLATILAVAALLQPGPLEVRFIGNMAVAVTDGTVTLVTDFPYESGYSGYMTYAPSAIRSTTGTTLALITHRHRDHWDDRCSRQRTGRLRGRPTSPPGSQPTAS